MHDCSAKFAAATNILHMGYRTLADCIADLDRARQLVRIEEEIDPYLEAAEIQRRVYAAGGPAIYFARVRGTPFPMVSNLFGTIERLRFIFRDTLTAVSRLVELKVDPSRACAPPLALSAAARTALHMLPKRVRAGRSWRTRPRSTDCRNSISWPDDGGPFVTLPEVYTEDPDAPGWRKSNLGMYRVQLAGNQYRTNEEVGLHYQIHRGIGVHHAAAIRAASR